jgi:hypothetical protein
MQKKTYVRELFKVVTTTGSGAKVTRGHQVAHPYAGDVQTDFSEFEDEEEEEEDDEEEEDEEEEEEQEEEDDEDEEEEDDEDEEEEDEE